MYGHILVPLDGSAMGEAALPHAEGLALKLGSSVLLLRVANVPPELIEEAIQSETDEARDYLTRVAQRFKDAGLQAEWEVVEGDPGRAIIDTAHERNADLIVMATHGRSGLSRLVLGSVADRVLRDSHLPVLMVRPPVPDPTP